VEVVLLEAPELFQNSLALLVGITGPLFHFIAELFCLRNLEVRLFDGSCIEKDPVKFKGNLMVHFEKQILHGELLVLCKEELAVRLEALKVFSDPIQVLQPLLHSQVILSAGNIVSQQTLKDFGCILTMLPFFYPSDYAIVGFPMCWHRELTGNCQ
jgi:hypothetical protein